MGHDYLDMAVDCLDPGLVLTVLELDCLENEKQTKFQPGLVCLD